MRPETAEYIAYAGKLLTDAHAMLDAALPDHAARTAYLACFHVARAYTFERGAAAGKTHRGVHSEFARLSRTDPRVDPALRGFLSQAYTYKAISDYETGPEDTPTPDEARDVVNQAARFVEEFVRLTPQPRD